MTDWKKYKGTGPWVFTPQTSKWGYLNNPRWTNPAEAFVKGGTHDYDGRETDEPQIWTPPTDVPQSRGSQPIHHQCGHWHLPGPLPPAETGGAAASIPLEMFHCSHYDDEVDTIWPDSETEIDPADYGGLSKIVHTYFEVVVDNLNARTIQLVDASDNVYATISVGDTSIPYIDSHTRFRSESFTLCDAKTKYYVKFPAVEGWCRTDCREARIIIDVTDTTKVRVEIPLIDSDYSAPGCNDTADGAPDYDYWMAWLVMSANQSYGYADDSAGDGAIADNFVLFKKEESKWSEIDHWTFDVILGQEECDFVYAALFNKTTGQMVAGSEISLALNENPITAQVILERGFTFEGSMPTRKTVDIANDAANFTDGHEFEVRIKAGNYTENGDINWSHVFLYSAKLYASVINATKFQVYWKYGSCLVGSFGAYSQYDNEVRTKFEGTKFPALTPIQFEVTARSNGTEADVYLHDMGPSDSGGAEVFCPATSADIISGDWDPNPLDANAFTAISAPDASLILTDVGGGTVRGGTFDTSAVPEDAVINSVRAYAVIGAAYDTPVAWELAGTPFSETMTWVYDPESTPPLAISYHSIVKALNSVPASVDVEVTRTLGPSDSTMYVVAQIGIYLGLSEDVLLTKQDIPATRTRLRIGDISGLLTEDNRYIMHFVIPDANNIVRHAMSFLIFEVDVSED